MSNICRRNLIARAVCGGVLRFSTVDGHLVVGCKRCERFDAGRCIECAWVIGLSWPRALRCLTCWRQQKRRIEARYSLTDQRRHDRRAYEKRRYQRTADVRREYARRQRVNAKLVILRGITTTPARPAPEAGR